MFTTSDLGVHARPILVFTMVRRRHRRHPDGLVACLSGCLQIPRVEFRSWWSRKEGAYRVYATDETEGGAASRGEMRPGDL